MADDLFPKEWWKLPQEHYNKIRAELTALANKDHEVNTKEQVRFFDKAITKIHAIISWVYKQLDERDANEMVLVRMPKSAGLRQ